MELKDKLKLLPELPGVYRFFGEDGNVLYIGKSKNLRSRVRSYFTGVKDGKVARLVRQINDVEYEICDTHLEARLLECQRIKEIRPMFNKQFKRQRGFVYLRFGILPKEAPLSLVFQPTEGIGPFRNRRLLESVIENFGKIYPLRWIDSDHLGRQGNLMEESRSKKIKAKIEFEYSVLPRRITSELHFEHQIILGQLFACENIWQEFIGELTNSMMRGSEMGKFQEAIFYRDFIEQLNLLHRMWFEDDQLFQELLFLKIPVEKGIKLFRVQNGLIESQLNLTTENEQEILCFMQSTVQEVVNPWREFTVSEQYEFHDILYSEIRSLPESQIIRATDK